MGYPAGVAGLTHSSSLKRRTRTTRALGDAKGDGADKKAADGEKGSGGSSTLQKWVKASTRLFNGSSSSGTDSEKKCLTTESKSASATASVGASFVVRRPATVVRMCTPRASVQVADMYTPLSPPPPYAFDLPAVHTRVAPDGVSPTAA